MRVALIAPNYYPAESGNAVTVRRIERQLRLLECEVKVFAVDTLPSEELLEGLKRFVPDLLHAFHAHRGGKVALALAQELGLPYLITLTGSDVYQALTDQRSHATHKALRGAMRLVAFHACVKRRLADHLPTVAERTVVIPQGVELGADRSGGASGDKFTFLLPAGIRPVKNVLFPFKPLAGLHHRHPELRLMLVGPVLDPDYAVQVLDALEEFPFVTYLGGVRHEEMALLYAQADVVLNCSLFEGGMANSVLEGLAHGTALLVADIEGNRSIIKDGVTGFLYRNADEFITKAERLVSEASLRQKLGRNGRSMVQAKYPPELEGRAYRELYREIVAEGGPGVRR